MKYLLFKMIVKKEDYKKQEFFIFFIADNSLQSPSEFYRL